MVAVQLSVLYTSHEHMNREALRCCLFIEHVAPELHYLASYLRHTQCKLCSDCDCIVMLSHNSSGTSLHSATGIINPLSAPSEWGTECVLYPCQIKNHIYVKPKARQYKTYMCWCLYAILFCTLDIAPDSASAIWPKMHMSWRITSLHRAVIVIVMLGSQYGLIAAPLHKHLNTHLGTNCCQAPGTDYRLHLKWHIII